MNKRQLLTDNLPSWALNCLLKENDAAETWASLDSSLFKWAVFASCLIRQSYCLVRPGIIYITHRLQTQTVMVISLMNMWTHKGHMKKLSRALAQ